MKPEFKLLRREAAYQGFFRVDRCHLQHSLFAGGQGGPIVRELVEKGDAAAVLLYDPEHDQLVLVEQFRVGAMENPGGAWLIELVAGYIEPGESPEDVVRREAQEEAGCEVLDLIPIFRYYVSPGGSSETMSLFCGRVRAPEDGGIFGLAEEDEDIRVHVLPFDRALTEVGIGRVDSAAPIIALQWLQLHREEVRAQWSAPASTRSDHL